MTNESRNEVEVVLDGKTWTLRPTFQRLREIEHKTGMAALALMRAIVQGEASLDHIVIVLEHGLKDANDDPPGFNEIGEWLLRDGANELVRPIMAFLASVALGGDAKKLLAPRPRKRKKAAAGGA